MAVTYVKRVGAPAGTITIVANGLTFVLNDTNLRSVTTSNAEAARQLDVNPVIQREFSTTTPYVPSVVVTPDGTFQLVQDATTGWPQRPDTPHPGVWIGWDDPTDLMIQYDQYIPIPEPT